MSLLGQKAKYSLRANDFRYAPNNGHSAVTTACPFGAMNRHCALLETKRQKLMRPLNP